MGQAQLPKIPGGARGFFNLTGDSKTVTDAGETKQLAFTKKNALSHAHEVRHKIVDAIVDDMRRNGHSVSWYVAEEAAKVFAGALEPHYTTTPTPPAPADHHWRAAAAAVDAVGVVTRGLQNQAAALTLSDRYTLRLQSVGEECDVVYVPYELEGSVPTEYPITTKLANPRIVYIKDWPMYWEIKRALDVNERVEQWSSIDWVSRLKQYNPGDNPLALQYHARVQNGFKIDHWVDQQNKVTKEGLRAKLSDAFNRMWYNVPGGYDAATQEKKPRTAPRYIPTSEMREYMKRHNVKRAARQAVALDGANRSGMCADPLNDWNRITNETERENIDFLLYDVLLNNKPVITATGDIKIKPKYSDMTLDISGNIYAQRYSRSIVLHVGFCRPFSRTAVATNTDSIGTLVSSLADQSIQTYKFKRHKECAAQSATIRDYVKSAKGWFLGKWNTYMSDYEKTLKSLDERAREETDTYDRVVERLAKGYAHLKAVRAGYNAATDFDDMGFFTEDKEEELRADNALPYFFENSVHKFDVQFVGLPMPPGPGPTAPTVRLIGNISFPAENAGPPPLVKGTVGQVVHFAVKRVINAHGEDLPAPYIQHVGASFQLRNPPLVKEYSNALQYREYAGNILPNMR